MKTIIFDFDGTIADTMKLVRSMVDEIAPTINHPGLSDDDIEQMRKMTIPQAFKYSKIPLRKLPQLALAARNYIKEHMSDMEPIPGIVDQLQELRDKEFQLAIVTSNSKQNVNAFLNRHNLREYFNFVESGVSTFGKSRLLRQTLRKHKLKKSDCIYVGDELRDISAAKSIKLPIISVGWGGNHVEALKKAKPLTVVEKPVDLAKVLEKSL